MASRTMVSGSVLRLLFAFLVIVFFGSREVKAGQARVTCQTSGASPLAADANTCVSYLVGLGYSECCQFNCNGADACTNMCGAGSAATDICGNCGNCVPCIQAGNYLATLVRNCEQSNGRVGGYVFGFDDPTLNVNVYHT